MDQTLQARFTTLWTKYFPGEDLPIGFYFSREVPQTPANLRCVLAALPRVRRGETVILTEASIQCFGAKAYLGYDQAAHVPSKEGEPYTFTEQFLSTGIPGQVPGERIKQSPEVCRQMYGTVPVLIPPEKTLVFKRWDKFEAGEEPEVVIFCGTGDMISGLYGLVSYDRADQFALVAPWGSGCSSLISDPYLEVGKDQPRAILGLLDVAGRPFSGGDELSIALPLTRLAEIVDFMEGSFLDTPAWEQVRRRMERKACVAPM